MRKFTKQISSLLAVVAAGTVTGGVVHALTTPLAGEASSNSSGYLVPANFTLKGSETQNTPLAGLVAITESEDCTVTTTGTEVYPIGTETSIRKTETSAAESFSEKYSETDITPTAGVPMITWPEEYTTTTTGTEVYPIGTETSSRKTETSAAESFSEKYSETQITQTSGEPITTWPEEFYTAPGTTPTYMMGTFVTTMPESEIKRGSGDIDMNGRTEVTDLTSLSLYMLKDKDLTEEQLKAADLTKDGEVNLADLAQLKMTVMHADSEQKNL